MVLPPCCALRRWDRLGRRCHQRSAVHSTARFGVMHVARYAAAAMAMAMGDCGRSFHSTHRVGRVSDQRGEADSCADLGIVSRIVSRNCRRLRRLADAAGKGQSEAGKISSAKVEECRPRPSGLGPRTTALRPWVFAEVRRLRSEVCDLSLPW